MSSTMASLTVRAFPQLSISPINESTLYESWSVSANKKLKTESYLNGLVEVPEADSVDHLEHALVRREGIRLLLEDLVNPTHPAITATTAG